MTLHNNRAVVRIFFFTGDTSVCGVVEEEGGWERSPSIAFPVLRLPLPWCLPCLQSCKCKGLWHPTLPSCPPQHLWSLVARQRLLWGAAGAASLPALATHLVQCTGGEWGGEACWGTHRGEGLPQPLLVPSSSAFPAAQPHFRQPFKVLGSHWTTPLRYNLLHFWMLWKYKIPQLWTLAKSAKSYLHRDGRV